MHFYFLFFKKSVHILYTILLNLSIAQKKGAVSNLHLRQPQKLFKSTYNYEIEVWNSYLVANCIKLEHCVTERRINSYSIISISRLCGYSLDKSPSFSTVGRTVNFKSSSLISCINSDTCNSLGRIYYCITVISATIINAAVSIKNCVKDCISKNTKYKVLISMPKIITLY